VYKINSQGWWKKCVFRPYILHCSTERIIFSIRPTLNGLCIKHFFYLYKNLVECTAAKIQDTYPLAKIRDMCGETGYSTYVLTYILYVLLIFCPPCSVITIPNVVSEISLVWIVFLPVIYALLLTLLNFFLYTLLF
jgi:Mg2+/Co2+ transporter CorB